MPPPASGPSRIEVHALVHATEEEEKVKVAIRNLFPEDAHGSLKFERKQLRGHFHNPIIRLQAILNQRDLIKETLHSLGGRLSPSNREQLNVDFILHTTKKGQFFLRFDKQESYQGRLQLVNRGDSLRVVIRFTGLKRDLDTLRAQCQQFKLI